MIYGYLHTGSGLGNQLHRYIATRVLALDRGYEFSIIGRNNFKGKDFMNLEFGDRVPQSWNYLVDPSGKILVDTHFDDTRFFEEKTNYYNPEINFVEDDTIIDGEFQDERYFEHRLTEINEWLKVEPIEVKKDVCAIGFRGGEFYVFPELGLPQDYYQRGISMMRNINPEMKFEVHTDDVELAKQFFPEFKIVHDVGVNWRSIRHAKYSIIANSSFYILPRLLRHRDPGSRIDFVEGGPFTIAPRFWARRNTGVWSMPQNYYKNFTYI